MRIDAYRSKTIGGSDRELVAFTLFTTGIGSEFHRLTIDEEDFAKKPSYPYYNGKYINLSATKDLTFRLIIFMDEDYWT